MTAIEMENAMQQEQVLGKENLALHIVLALLILLFLGGIAAVANILYAPDHHRSDHSTRQRIQPNPYDKVFRMPTNGNTTTKPAGLPA